MKITIDREKLVEVCDIASRFVSKNSTLPILQNIYMKASIDTLNIRATDMEKYVDIEIPCKINLEWAITVNAKMFLDLLKTIDEKTIEISVNMQNNIMQIVSADDDFTINWISASEYVALPELMNTTNVNLDTQTFINWVNMVEYTITEKNFSPVLTWVFIKTKSEWENKKLVFVWTDSFRIAEFKLPATIESDFSLLIPKTAINDITSIAEYAAKGESPDMQMKYEPYWF